MSPLEAIRLVAGREVRERLQGRVIWITTAIMVLAVVAAIVIPALLHQPSAPNKIGLVGDAAQAAGPDIAAAAKVLKVSVRTVPVASEEQAKSEVRAGRLPVALVLGPSGTTALVQQAVPQSVELVIAYALQARHQAEVLAAANVPPQVIAQTLQPITIRTDALAPAPNIDSGRYVAAFASALLLYVSLLTYGQLVASGVAQEKTSRTAEVLLATLRPSQLLTGKVAGIGACALGQMAVTVGAGLVANALAHSALIPATTWALLPAVLLWFLLGYVLYSFAFAAAGSLVSRQEEVNMVSSPFTVLLVGSYLLMFAALGDPNAPWVVGLSFVPPLAPIFMPVRIALGSVPAWQVAASAVLILAATAGVIAVAARIYSRALVRSG
ncbi:MAG: ABC transporter permease, partial [Candidatus Dormiibacterota bacterium]